MDFGNPNMNSTALPSEPEFDQHACRKCHKLFGINYESQQRSHDQSITSLISTTRLTIVLAFRFQSCAHSVCEECILKINYAKKLDENKKICPVCQENDSYQKAQPFEVNLNLLGKTLLESNQNHFTRLNLDLNDKNKFFTNTKNEEKIRCDISRRFLMRCGYCSDRNQRDISLAEKHHACNSFVPNTVDTYCFNCTSAYCEPCYKILHGSCTKNAKHTPIPLQSLQELPCAIHNNVLNYYSLDTNKMICSDCIVRSTTMTRFVEIHFKAGRFELIENYKKSFRDHETSLKSSLASVVSDLNRIMPDNASPKEQIDFIIQTRNTEQARELKNKICELEQSLWITKHVLMELDYIAKNRNNFLINYSSDKLTINSVLDHYLRLVSTVDNPFIDKPRPNKIYLNSSIKNQERSYQYESESSTINSMVHSPKVKHTYHKKVNHKQNFDHKKETSNQSTPSESNNETNQSTQYPSFRKVDSNNNNVTNQSSSVADSSTRSDTDECYYDIEDEFTTPVNKPFSKQNTRQVAVQDTPDKFVELEPGFVGPCKILSVESMSCIWVRLMRGKLPNLGMLKKWCESDSQENRFSQTEKSTLSVGNMVAYFSIATETKIWTRAKITAFSSGPNSDEESNEPLKTTVQLFLVDYGISVENVNLECVKKLPANVLAMPLILHKCFLHNLRPYSNDLDADENNPVDAELSLEDLEHKKLSYEWSDHCKNMLHVWAKTNKNINIHVLNKIGDNYFGIELEGQGRKRPGKGYEYVKDISSKMFSEVLVKTKLGVHEHEQNNSIDTDKTILELMPNYIPMEALDIEQNIIGCVCDFNRLDYFSIRQLFADEESDKAFGDLIVSMKDEYARVTDIPFMDPVVGMPVAAAYSVNGCTQWHRAQIVKIHPGTYEADVYFVDYGNIGTMSISNLRYMHEEFFVLEILVFRCSLFGIKFENESMLLKASDYFYEKIARICQSLEKTIQVFIKNIVHDSNAPTIFMKDTYEVIIRFPVNETVINFNVHLVKEGFAESVSHGIYHGEKEPKKENRSATVHIMKAPALSKLDILVNEVLELKSKCLTNTPDTKVLCKVTNAISPDEIWVQDSTDVEEFYEKFQKILCEKYTPLWEENDFELSNKNSWRVGDLCVIKHPRRKAFFRAKLVKKSGQTFTAIYLDIGNYEHNVETVQIFRLIEEFQTKPEFKAKKCRVSGVKPTGSGDGQWGSLAKTFVTDILIENFIYVDFLSTKKSDDSYDICIYHNAKQTSNHSLYPIVTNQFVRFSDLLNHKGLAFLEEKHSPINQLLLKRAERNELATSKSCPIISQPDTFNTYPTNKTLLSTIEKAGLASIDDQCHDVLVTNVNLENGLLSVQFYKCLDTQQMLSEMQTKFKNYYGSGAADNKGYSAKFFQEFLSKGTGKINSLLVAVKTIKDIEKKPDENQTRKTLACVCRINEKFYRCNILSRLDKFFRCSMTLNEQKTVNEFQVVSIDYGFQACVTIDQIYRPMVQLLDTPPQAFKLQLSLPSALKENYPQLLQDNVYNHLAKLKIVEIIDEEDGLFLSGDVLVNSMNTWCSRYLNNNETVFYEDEVFLGEEEPQCGFRSFELPSDIENKGFKAIILYEQIESNLLWLRLDGENLDPTDSSSKNLKAYTEMELEYLSDSEEDIIKKRINLEMITQNLPCVSYFSADGCLYRGVVKDVNYIENTANVNFIDYGNVEVVNLENIFELDEKYLDVPKQQICCKLLDILVNENLADEYKKMNKNVLIDIVNTAAKDNKLYAKFQNKSQNSFVLSDINYDIDVILYISNNENDKFESLLEHVSIMNSEIGFM